MSCQDASDHEVIPSRSFPSFTASFSFVKTHCTQPRRPRYGFFVAAISPTALSPSWLAAAFGSTVTSGHSRKTLFVTFCSLSECPMKYMQKTTTSPPHHVETYLSVLPCLKAFLVQPIFRRARHPTFMVLIFILSLPAIGHHFLPRLSLFIPIKLYVRMCWSLVPKKSQRTTCRAWKPFVVSCRCQVLGVQIRQRRSCSDTHFASYPCYVPSCPCLVVPTFDSHRSRLLWDRAACMRPSRRLRASV